MNRFEKAAEFGSAAGRAAFYKMAGNPTLDFYRKQQEQELAEARAQAAAIRSAAGVSGSGGGTATGRVVPDGKGGYRVEGAKYTPQAGYDQKGNKITPNAPTNKPKYKLRDDPRFKEDYDEIAEEQANIKQMQGATGRTADGNYRGTFRQGQIQPGATFTPYGGQNNNRPMPGAGGQPVRKPMPSAAGQQGNRPMPGAGFNQNMPPRGVPNNKAIPNRRVILDN